MTAATERAAESLHCTACSHHAQLDPEVALERAVESALRAPSAYNAQPWRFRIIDGSLELHADLSRARPVADPHNRELYLSCGAALENIRLALRHLGRDPEIAILPSCAHPQLVARVRVGALRHPTLADSRFFTAIPQRRSSRARFYSRPIPLGVAPSLAQAVEASGATLRYLYSECTREALAEIITFADRIQAHDAKFRLELASWLRGNQTDRPDGIPGFAFGLSAPMAALAPLALHAMAWDSMRVVRDDELAREAPLIGVLLAPGDQPLDWVRAGQGMERALLFAASQGLASGIMNQAIQVPDARERVRELLNTTSWPMSILRFGFGPETRPTPRRNLADVLVRDHEVA